MWEILEKLEPWPALQFAVAAVIVLVAIHTYFKTLGSKTPPSKLTNGKVEAEALLLFHGPFGRLDAKLDTLVANQKLNKAEMKEAFAEALQETRHSLGNKLAGVQAELKEDLDLLKKEILDGQTDIRADISGTRREMRGMRAVVDRTSELAIRMEARRGRST